MSPTERRVQDLMTTDVTVIDQARDVHELEKLLISKKVHGLPVVDSDQRLVGVVSQTDLLAWHYDTGVDGCAFYDYSNLIVRDQEDFSGLRLSDIQTATVAEVMSPVVHCIRPDRPIALAAAKMIEERVHRLVVVDEENHVLGVISAIDLLHAVPGVELVSGTST